MQQCGKEKWSCDPKYKVIPFVGGRCWPQFTFSTSIIIYQQNVKSNSNNFPNGTYCTCRKPLRTVKFKQNHFISGNTVNLQIFFRVLARIFNWTPIYLCCWFPNHVRPSIAVRWWIMTSHYFRNWSGRMRNNLHKCLAKPKKWKGANEDGWIIVSSIQLAGTEFTWYFPVAYSEHWIYSNHVPCILRCYASI